MGSIPVAKPAPDWGSRARRSQFPVLPVLSILGVCLAAAVVVTIFLWPTESGPVFSAGRVDDLRQSEPVHYDEGGFYLALLPGGEIIALADVDVSAAQRDLDCETIPWLPEFEFMGRTGWFREACVSSTFAVDGMLVAGPASRGMDRYAVEVRDGEVLVDTSDVSCHPATQPIYCPYPERVPGG